MTSQQELNNVAAMLKRNGYRTELNTSNLIPKYVTVFDPVFNSGTGGKLVFSHDEPVIIRSYDSARKFINARS